MLAFTVIVVWEKYNEAHNAVAQEAAATAALFRYAEGKEVEAQTLRGALVKYMRSAIDDEWPKMEEESYSHDVTVALSDVYRTTSWLFEVGEYGGQRLRAVYELDP